MNSDDGANRDGAEEGLWAFSPIPHPPPPFNLGPWSIPLPFFTNVPRGRNTRKNVTLVTFLMNFHPFKANFKTFTGGLSTMRPGAPPSWWVLTRSSSALLLQNELRGPWLAVPLLRVYPACLARHIVSRKVKQTVHPNAKGCGFGLRFGLPSRTLRPILR